MNANTSRTISASSVSTLDSRRQQEILKMITARRALSQGTSQSLSENPSYNNEYVLPIRLTALQKRVYTTILLEHAALLELTGNEVESSKPENQGQMRKMIQTLNHCTLHPFLVARTEYAPRLSESDEAWYIIQASSKFEFFVELAESLRHQPIRLGVLSSDLSVIHLLQSVCIGLQIHYAFPDVEDCQESAEDEYVGDLEVLIMTAEDVCVDNPVDICLAFDSLGTYNLAPVVRMVASNSAEHVERQVSELVTQVSTIVASHEHLGICITDGADTVQHIVRYLCGDPFNPELLQELTFAPSQLDVRSRTASVMDATSHMPFKQLELGLELDQEPPHIIISEIDGLEVHTEAPPDPYGLADSQLNQSMGALSSDVQPLDRIAPAQTSQFVSPQHLEHNPTPIPEQKRTQLFYKEETDRHRITTLEGDIERMMLRFDELLESHRSLGELRDESQARLASLQKRFERLLEEAQTARRDKNEVKMELDRMKMPPLPEESSEDYLRTENTRLKTELEKVRKSMDSKMEDFEFVRQQYQQSSTAAAELATENASLKDTIALLTNKVEGGAGYKLAIQQHITARMEAEEETKTLELRNNVLIEQLRRMRDDKLSVATTLRGRGDRDRDSRRDLIQSDRKRASSAQEVGSRKKVDKEKEREREKGLHQVAASPLQRLSVANLIDPPPPSAPSSSSSHLLLHSHHPTIDASMTSFSGGGGGDDRSGIRDDGSRVASAGPSAIGLGAYGLGGGATPAPPAPLQGAPHPHRQMYASQSIRRSRTPF